VRTTFTELEEVVVLAGKVLPSTLLQLMT